LIAVCAAVLLASFTFLQLIPGDPVTIRLGEHADASQVAALRAELGLDKPWYVRMERYLVRAAHADLGVSAIDAQPVAEKLAAAFPATVELAGGALLFALFVGIPTGMYAAVHRRGTGARIASGVAVLGVSVPIFWLGWVLIYAFAVLPDRWGLDLFPISGRSAFAYVVPTRTHFLLVDALLAGNIAAAGDALRHLVLPAVTLGVIPMASFIKITRASMLDVLNAPYIRTARAKGLSPRVVVWRHALRNALFPLLTVAGLQAGMLLGGAVLTEHIFSWPGVGRLAFNAVADRDAPVINGCILLFALVFVFVNALVDIFYTLLDPRLREGFP
jgi:peptide/nickel transport system permease protein